MVVVLSKSATKEEKDRARAYLESRSLSVRELKLGDDEAFAVIGKAPVDAKELELLPGVERAIPVTKPYQLASRETKPEDTIVTVGPVKVGGARITVIAGPCAVESKSQIMETAALVRESGAVMLRGGAFKPRTSPYAFQGLGMEGLEYLKAAGEAYGMPIVTEVVSPEAVAAMRDLTDVFQIGARNMQNFELLKKVGSAGRAVLLKRGASATIEEWLLSAEYLLAAGTADVILCERGIRTFETYTRNTLDISAIPVVKKLSHLPVIVDPSHATGIRDKVSPVALAGIAAGADGLTVEVHPRPDEALSDGPQSLYPAQFEKLMRDVEALAPVVGKELLRTPEPVSLRSESSGGAAPAKAPAAAELPVAFSGEHGAYAEQAAVRVFGEDKARLPVGSFAQVFDAVLTAKARYGVVPVENSLAGSIHENYDLFIRYPDISIVGEVKLRIIHCLLGLPGAKLDGIRLVRSHPQGFAQCREFLDAHPDWIREPSTDTGGAAASVARSGDPSIAAISGEIAGTIHGLVPLKCGIETNPLNYTRFLVLARTDDRDAAADLGGAEKFDKASMVFSTSNDPGSLFEALRVLQERTISLSKLESRPIPGKPWRYLFYADVSVPEPYGEFSEAIEELKKKTEDFRFLGEYRASL